MLWVNGKPAFAWFVRPKAAGLSSLISFAHWTIVVDGFYVPPPAGLSIARVPLGMIPLPNVARWTAQAAGRRSWRLFQMIGTRQPRTQIIRKLASVRTYGWVRRWLSCRIGDCVFQSLKAIYNCPAQFPAVQLQLFQSFAAFKYNVAKNVAKKTSAMIVNNDLA